MGLTLYVQGPNLELDPGMKVGNRVCDLAQIGAFGEGLPRKSLALSRLQTSVSSTSPGDNMTILPTCVESIHCDSALDV